MSFPLCIAIFSSNSNSLSKPSLRTSIQKVPFVVNKHMTYLIVLRNRADTAEIFYIRNHIITNA